MDMDIEWIKIAVGVVAQHGPWALFAWWLANQHFKRHDALTGAMVGTATALVALKTYLEDRINREEGPQK